MHNRLGLICVCAMMVVAAPAWGLEVKATLRESASVARHPGVVAMSVPFARGSLADAARLSVTVEGKLTPAQCRSLAPWDDGSVRWAQVVFLCDLPAGGEVNVVLRDDGRNAAPDTPVRVQDGADAVAVDCGPLQFSIPRKTNGLFKSVKVDGRETLTAKGRGIVLFPEQGDAVEAGPPTTVMVEEAGPLRVVVRAQGVVPGVHNDRIGYTVRLTAHAGQKRLDARVWIENAGARGYGVAPEWFWFKGLAVELGLDLGGAVTAVCEATTAPDGLRVEQRCPGARWDNFAYTITSAGKPLGKGQRTDGVVTLQSAGGQLTTAIRHFWQNYDKAIELDGTSLRLWLWPIGSQWPRPEGFGGDVGGGGDRDFIAQTRKPKLTALPGGVRKSHEFTLDFSGRAARETLAELAAPVMGLDPAYVAGTVAANALFAPAQTMSGDEEVDWKLRFWNSMAAAMVDPNNKGGLPQARSTGAEANSVWFGWMDFGDLPTPTGTHYSGQVAPRHLHQDWTWLALLQYLRTGERGYFDLGLEMARHQIEVDQDWSDRDAEPARWLGTSERGFGETHFAPMAGGGQPSVAANWISGVVLYYLLTGDPMAKDAALRNLQASQAWVRQVADKPGPSLPYPTTMRVMRNLLSTHAMTGDAKRLDEVRTLISSHLAKRYQAWGPLMFNAQDEVRSQDYNRLAEGYCLNVPTLCEAHFRTGDELLGKMIREAVKADLPHTFYLSSLCMSDLQAYAGWLDKNAAGIAAAGDNFADGFPESRKPPIFHPGQNDWSGRAAMFLHAGHALQYVLWRQRQTKPE